MRGPTRRQVLAGGVAAVGTTLVTLPIAHADASLELAVDVTGVRWAGVEDEPHDWEAAGLDLVVTSDEETSVEPVVFLWGRFNGMMQSWPQTVGPGRIDPGERVELSVEAPAPETWLYPDQPAQVTVVDRGTERRAKTTFVPEFERDGQR